MIKWIERLSDGKKVFPNFSTMKKKIIIKKCVAFLLIPLAVISCKKDGESINIYSPDKAYNFEIFVNSEKSLSYSLTWHDSLIISESKLGYKLANDSVVRRDLKLTGVKNQTIDEEWNPVFGEQNTYRNYYNESKIYITC